MYLFNYRPSNLFDLFHFYKNLEDNKISEIFKLTSNINFEKATTSKETFQHSRKSQIKWITLAEHTEGLFNYLENIINEANKSYFNFDLFYSQDDIQYTEYYHSVKGKYDWHMDSLSPNRKLSLTIQLSDPTEYEGGDLEIYVPHPEEPEILKAPKEKGKIIVFPSYMFHRVTPVTKGVRKSLVWWVGGTPFR